MSAPPVDLDWYLNHFAGWLPAALGVPMWRDVLITEHVDYDAGLPRRLAELHRPEEYRARFVQLVTSGWAWINLHAVGLLGETLILAVELPGYPPPGLSPTSVNLSGPVLAMRERGYDLRGLIENPPIA
jgi:hypothetical protein